MNKKIVDILNNQIKEEMYSANLYLALSARLESWNLKGMANWMRIQAQEENNHAMGFFYFLLDRGEEPVIPALEMPDLSKIGDTLHVFEETLEHEKHITSCINKIYEVAREENDYPLESFIRWYIDEQVEEEASATEIKDKLKLVGNTGPALYMIDQELGARVYTEYIPGKTKA